MPHPDDRSVYPCDESGRTDHATDGSPCWCGPRLVVLCTQCEDATAPDPACWLCGGEGMIDAEADVLQTLPMIAIHNDVARPSP